MTPEQRVDDLMAHLPYLTKTEGGVKGFKERLSVAVRDIRNDALDEAVETAGQDSMLDWAGGSTGSAKGTSNKIVAAIRELKSTAGEHRHTG